MKVFISWSGERSRKVGELLNEWLQCVLQAVEPWMSSKNIERGTTWFTEIFDQLSDTSIGIICLTQENKNKPWILFESGVLAKGLTSSRVCTFLIDLEPRDLEPPLSQFNHTFVNEESILSLVTTLNARLGDRMLKENVLQAVFNTYYSQFEEKFAKLIQETPDTTPVVERDSNDILNEILMNTRSYEKRISAMEMNYMDSNSIKSSLKNLRAGDLYNSDNVIISRAKYEKAKEIENYILSSLSSGRELDEVITDLDLLYDLPTKEGRKLVNQVAFNKAQ